MKRRGYAILILALIAALVFAVSLALWRPAPPEASAPVIAAAPGGFVGIETCARCHLQQAADHATSGHSHTFARAIESDVAKRWNGRSFQDPERKYEYHYRFGTEGLSTTIPAKFGDQSFPLDFVFGSGRHAVSFLTLVPNRQGETDGVEHRISSFGSDERLALTPGHRGEQARQKIEEFGMVHLRSSTELDRCVECHTTTGTIRGPDIENLLPNVTCESCHGPGEAHVRAQQRSQKPDLAGLRINSRWTAQAQLEMCGRCHRRTDQLSKPPERHDYKIVRFQPVGLSQSQCYIKSDGHLMCTTCHDPHHAPVADTAYYDRKCLECHSKDLSVHTSCPSRRKTGCSGCHMPSIQVHPGFVFSDHWIRVRKPDDLPVFSKANAALENTLPTQSAPSRK